MGKVVSLSADSTASKQLQERAPTRTPVREKISKSFAESATKIGQVLQPAAARPLREGSIAESENNALSCNTAPSQQDRSILLLQDEGQLAEGQAVSMSVGSSIKRWKEAGGSLKQLLSLF